MAQEDDPTRVEILKTAIALAQYMLPVDGTPALLNINGYIHLVLEYVILNSFNTIPIGILVPPPDETLPVDHSGIHAGPS